MLTHPATHSSEESVDELVAMKPLIRIFQLKMAHLPDPGEARVPKEDRERGGREVGHIEGNTRAHASPGALFELSFSSLRFALTSYNCFSDTEIVCQGRANLWQGRHTFKDGHWCAK